MLGPSHIVLSVAIGPVVLAGNEMSSRHGVDWPLLGDRCEVLLSPTIDVLLPAMRPDTDLIGLVHSFSVSLYRIRVAISPTTSPASSPSLPDPSAPASKSSQKDSSELSLAI